MIIFVSKTVFKPPTKIGLHKSTICAIDVVMVFAIPNTSVHSKILVSYQYVVKILIKFFLDNEIPHQERSIPSQTTPSPDHPNIHTQMKLPFVFMQLAFMSQLTVPLSHSSTSLDMYKVNNRCRVQNHIN